MKTTAETRAQMRRRVLLNFGDERALLDDVDTLLALLAKACAHLDGPECDDVRAEIAAALEGQS